MIAPVEPKSHTSFAPMLAGQAFLKIDHVSKTFRRNGVESHVLNDVSLSIARGSYVSIIGHSGCGKHV
jgi:ABC-type nitrate/sulfonate/bicarbonate transport system ATPase subunit